MKGIEIRPLESQAEREACVAVQEEVWGRDFRDRVPASILLIATETGGVATGAFEGDRLVGFVFGITGIRNGVPTHWSDMLAVRASHRGRGIGYRLKLHQRQELLGRGVGLVRWTFDPLEARNAHLNLNRLGALVGAYRRDLYGASNSPPHAGIGTDRLVAEWELESDRVRRRIGETGGGGERDVEPPGSPGSIPAPHPGAPVQNPWRTGSPHPQPAGEPRWVDGPVVRVAVPADIQALKRDDLELARHWRRTARTALERCFDAGYTAVAAEPDGSVWYYVLARSLAR